jgi:hypothetical protein
LGVANGDRRRGNEPRPEEYSFKSVHRSVTPDQDSAERSGTLIMSGTLKLNPTSAAGGCKRLLDNDLLENEMAKFKLVVMTDPKAGREDEYNDWYTNQHLADVVAVPGFRSAQRFKLNDGMGFEHRNRYLAIYEIESDDPQEALAEMFRRRGTPAMVVSESLDLDKASVGLFEPCSSVVEAGAKPRQAAAR